MAAWLVAGGRLSAVAEEAPRASEVWRGYVWKDEQGRLRLGQGVVAMGVMGYPPHVVAGPAAERLAAYAVADDDYVFWNYALEETDETRWKGLPTALVRLEGPVAEGADTAPEGHWPTSRPKTMTARVTAIEFVRREWLRSWAVFFREKASPWRIHEDADTTPAGRKAFAARGLAALEAMLAVPAPTDADRATARALDSACRVVESFRRAEEEQIQRWLRDADAKEGWKLPGLERLPPLPPDATRIQGWFLDAPTKAAFLERVAREYKGDLQRLELIHYVARENSTTYARADLLEVRDGWTEAVYQANRDTTVKMGVRR